MWPTEFMSNALSRISLGMTLSAVPQAAIDPARQIVASGLHGLYKRDEDDHDGEHHVRHEALIFVADAEIAQPTPADRANHRRIAQQADDRERQRQNKSRQRFGYQDLEHD